MTPAIYVVLHNTYDIQNGPLEVSLRKALLTKNTAKWRVQLTEYDVEFVARVSIKGQAIADHLAEFPIDDNHPISLEF